MSDAVIHPTPQELIAFGLGKLPEHAAAVAAHLAVCAACRQAVAGVIPDSFFDKDRATGPGGSLLPSSPAQPGNAPNSAGRLAMPGIPYPNLPPELARHPKYHILRELGRGGMGVVYQARHKEMARQIVIKVINRSLLDQPGALERFRREIRAAAQLSDPNIVTAYDAEQAGELHMLVMEFVPGRSLAEVLEKKGPLPMDKACQYVSQAALGLQHAYKRNMVHRDIKPSNLMLTPQGQVKILDFGLAKIISESGTHTGITESDSYMGTPEYSAPEQATDARSADIRADIYSLGCTLYCLLAGRPPFCEETAMKTVLAHMQQQPQPLTELRPDVPERLWRAVERMLAKEPGRRYQKPKEVVLALAPFVKPSSKGGSAPAPGVGSPSKGTGIETDSEIKKILRKAPCSTSSKDVPARDKAPSFADWTDETGSPNEVERFGDEEMPPRSAWWKRPGVLAGAFGVSLALILTVIFLAAKPQRPDKETNTLNGSDQIAGTSDQHKSQDKSQGSKNESKITSGESKKSGEQVPIEAPPDPEPLPVADALPSKGIEDKPAGERGLKPRLLPGLSAPEAKALPAKEFESSCEAARTKLLDGFDKVISALAKGNAPVDEKLKLMDMVKNEKARFANGGFIPWSEPMRPHVDPYLHSLRMAQTNLRATYESLIEKELQTGNDEEVGRLRSEWKKRLDVKKMAKWRQIVNGKGPGDVHTLYSNGTINNSDGKAVWYYVKGVLFFQWPDPNAAGGLRIEILEISADGTTYTGTNNDTPEKRPKLTGVYEIPRNQPTETKPPKALAQQREKRMLRWSMLFDTHSAPVYLAQLQGLGAILAVPVHESGANREYRIIRNLSARPAKLLQEDVSKIQRICWVDDNPQSVMDVMAVLRVPVRPSHFVTFMPEELENKLFRLEMAYLKNKYPGRTENDIVETKFQIKRTGRGYEPVVVELKIK